MLKIRKLKIDITTLGAKKFGCYYEFEANKLNIVKGTNHSGKTTLVSAIFYGMGMEELLGGQNTKALDSILISVVPFKGTEYKINESAIYIEIENSNNKIITIKRYSKHVDINPKIAYIYENPLSEISEKNKIITYLHDGGSAQNPLGFYKYLADYINYNLPLVPSYSDKEMKLYLQVVFNAYFVEQLKGWTDFFATIPSFNMKEPKKRIVEFLLNLEANEFEKDKFNYEVEKERIANKWAQHIVNIKSSVEEISANIKIKYVEPISIDQFRDSEFEIFFINDDEEKIEFTQAIDGIEVKTKELNEEITKPKDKNEEKLFEIRGKLKNIARKISKLNEIINIKTNSLKQSENELQKIESEITNLTDLQKVRKLLNDNTITSQIAQGVCPTCHQEVDSSFYSKIEVMGVDDNKEYLVAQKRILEIYIKSINKEIEQQKEIILFLAKEHAETLNIIRYLEKDIVLNTNMATYKEIVNLETKSKLYKKVEKYVYTIKKELDALANDWKNNEMRKVSYDLSPNDSQKIDLLEKYFKRYLFEFGYGSKDSSQIHISKKPFEQYFPVVKIFDKDQKIRINSSASDFVRNLWAYYISLFEVSKEKNGNHIGLFIFDEPAQHAMDEINQKAFLERLSKLNSCQSIVFSSFEDKDNSPSGNEKFKNMIKDIDKSKIHIIEIKSYSILEINSEIKPSTAINHKNEENKFVAE